MFVLIQEPCPNWKTLTIHDLNYQIIEFFVEVIGSNQVSVPTHFFKVIVGETQDLQLEMEAFVLPNQVLFFF